MTAGGVGLQRLGVSVDRRGHVGAARHVLGERDLILAGAEVGDARDAATRGQGAALRHAGEQVAAAAGRCLGGARDPRPAGAGRRGNRGDRQQTAAHPGEHGGAHGAIPSAGAAAPLGRLVRQHVSE